MEEQFIRTGVAIFVVVDILEVTVVSAATLPQNARATIPKAAQAARRFRMLRLEMGIIVCCLSGRVARR